ncbi:MAG: IS66 family transposase [bacterium]
MNKEHCLNCARLQAELEEKGRRITQLEGEKVLLAYDLKQLRDKWFSRRKKKLGEETGEIKQEPKKRGAPKGHAGWFRKKPDRVDIEEEVTLERCPQCGSRELTECCDTEEHIQEDIILPRLEVRKYLHRFYWCKTCKEVVSGIGKEEIPRSYIGPKAKAVAAYLKYTVKVSQRDIQKIFAYLCGLKVTASSIPGFNNQVRRKALPLYEELKTELKKAAYVHADETGAPVDGDNYWDWVFATTRICLHVIDKSRGQKVVEAVLGKRYGGILVSDFLGAYNKLEAKAKQKCLVHLLRDLKKILECTGEDDPHHVYCRQLKNLLQQAIDLSGLYGGKEISKQKFEVKRRLIKETLGDFQFPDPQKSVLTRISKRLARHKDELFTFLDYPGIPYHNNHAERLIRPSVLLRKITFGNRSLNGVLNHDVLMSLQQTARLNDKNPIRMLNSILTHQKKLPLSFCLGP